MSRLYILTTESRGNFAYFFYRTVLPKCKVNIALGLTIARFGLAEALVNQQPLTVLGPPANLFRTTFEYSDTHHMQHHAAPAWN